MDIVNIVDALKQHPPGSFIDLTAFNGCKFVYFTPGQSLHSEAADPRASD
ncbi:MAG: hypothetical protein AB8B96_06165 [Lysobacterales bacterium]